MRVLLTAGTWDLNGGKQSGLISKMYELLKKESDLEIDYFNGGNYKDLENIVLTSKNYEVIFWMANVPNDLPKVRFVKTINPFALVIGSKRNHYGEYSFVEVLNKSLEQRNNLTIQFSKTEENKNFKMLLFDPLGTSWYDGYELNELVKVMMDRIRFILTTRREKTYKVDGSHLIPNDEEFFKYVREVAEIFHKTIEHADGVTRFLGNASFRGEDVIYITRRDVDKSLIDKDNFVAAYLDDNKVFYYGDNKPSKDTVVQTRLYEMFKNINFIVHSHCYAENAPFTKEPVPCGALDEIDEVLQVVKEYYNNDFSLDYYKINLIGHGCLIFGRTLDNMKNTNYLTRHLPEHL